MSYYKLERKCKNNLYAVAGERPGSGLQLTVTISRGTHIKHPTSKGLDNQDRNLTSTVNGRIKAKRGWYVEIILYLNANRIVLLSAMLKSIDCAA